MAKHLALGVSGEAVAKIYCEHLGWPVLATNVRVGKHKEIDLIAKDGVITVFIEVKTRTGDAFGAPEESMTSKKLSQLDQAIAIYVREHSEAKHIRLDVIAITYAPDGMSKPKLKHIKGVGGNNPLATLL